MTKPSSLKAVLEAARKIDSEGAERRRRDRDAVDAAAVELGVTLEMFGGLAPYQILGQVDGMRFYLRERHGEWDLTVPDENAGADGDPIDAHHTVVIARGGEQDLYDPDDATAPLRRCAHEVRLHLRRLVCQHPASGMFCPDCGQHTGQIL